MKTRLLIILLAAVGFSFTRAAILNVPIDFTTIQAAINAAQPGDTVLVYPGVYHENINFRNKGIVVASRFLTTNDTAYIDATVINGSNPVNQDTASCVIITGLNLASSPDSSAALIGFRITGGKGTKWDDEHNPGIKYREGGGILIQYASPRILFNHICFNEAIYLLGCASAGGGAIRCGDGNPKIRNNVIDNNRGRYGAGLVFNFSGADVRNNVISLNWGGEDYGGGGIWVAGADLLGRVTSVVNNTIVYNSSELGGGGVRSWNGSMVLRNNIIYRNSAPTWPQIQVTGNLQVEYCDVEGGYPGNGNVASDPAFDPINYYLSPFSPCIDKGDSSAAYNDPPVPGNPSLAAFPAKGMIRNDMGAYGGPGSALMANIPSILTGQFEKAEESSVMAVYPNPVRVRITIELPHYPVWRTGGQAGKRTGGAGNAATVSCTQPGSCTLEIRDLSGKLVCSEEVRQQQQCVEMDVSRWQAGMYLARVLFMGELVSGAKIIVE